MQPIHPVKSYSHALSGASLNIAIDPAVGAQRILWNSGSVPAFYALGSSNALTASATDHALPPGAVYLISLEPNETYMALYSAGSTTVYITAGEGN